MADKTIPDVVYLEFAPDFVSVSQHAHDEYHGFVRKDLVDELVRDLCAIRDACLGSQGDQMNRDTVNHVYRKAYGSIRRINAIMEGK